MSFWIYWEHGFQAFMVIIGVSLVWLRFIEPLFASRGLSVIVMIIVAFGLAFLQFYRATSGIRKQLQAAQAKIDSALREEVL